MNLIHISDLTAGDVFSIWNFASNKDEPVQGRVAWSFEDNGIRTRTGFIQAFQELGLRFVELPNLLKTTERTTDLAAYLDDFYDIYVIRERNHERLAEFAGHSCRPVVNALSSQGHPCEVLTDAYYVNQVIAPIQQARVCLWGPPTNVMQSWHELAVVMGFQVTQLCEAVFHEVKPNVRYSSSIESSFDIVITDGWPESYTNADWSLTSGHLEQMGSPHLLPTPPFSIGREIAFDPVSYAGFTGYRQKSLLLPMQKAILAHLLNDKKTSPKLP